MLRYLKYRSVHQLDLETPYGRRLRWTGQQRYSLWNIHMGPKPVGMTGTFVGSDRPGQWAYLEMEDGLERRALPPSARREDLPRGMRRPL